jgi:hypothetical protein
VTLTDSAKGALRAAVTLALAARMGSTIPLVFEFKGSRLQKERATGATFSISQDDRRDCKQLNSICVPLQI